MKEKKITKLRGLRLKRISLVDNPANEHARVVLLKRADEDAEKGDLSTESRDDKSDAQFAAVWTDPDGKKQRKLPINDAAHVRNALARFGQTDMPANVKAKAKAKLDAAKAKFGIGEDKAEKGISSFETKQEAIRSALKKVLGDPWAPGATNWTIEATYDDHVIVNQSGERWSYPFTWDEDEDDVDLGERTDVEVEYVPVTEKAMANPKDKPADKPEDKPAEKPNENEQMQENEPGSCPRCETKMGKSAVYCAKCGMKMAGEDMTEKSNKEGEAMDLSKIADEELRKQVQAMASELETLKKGKTEDEDVLKGLSPAVRERLEKAEAAAKLASDEVSKMQDEKVEKSFIEKAASYNRLGIKAAEFGVVLKRLAQNKSTDEDMAELDRVLKAANEAAKVPFKVVGSSERPVGNTASDELMVLAKEKVAKAEGKLDLAAAIHEVQEENPVLYKRYRVEAFAKPTGTEGEE